jgi:hypothetical protein
MENLDAISVIRQARDRLKEAEGLRCVCSGIVLQYEGGCCCERGKAIVAARQALDRAIEAL